MAINVYKKETSNILGIYIESDEEISTSHNKDGSVTIANSSNKNISLNREFKEEQYGRTVKVNVFLKDKKLDYHIYIDNKLQKKHPVSSTHEFEMIENHIGFVIYIHRYKDTHHQSYEVIFRD